MSSLTLGSLFDGSGGFPLGALLSGIKPIWASEIEPFPIRVTTKRLPFLKHYGDVNKINGGHIEPVDIITFGSPCTNMSIAGKREGLNGTQSVLFYQAIRIIKEMRCATSGRYPRFIVWENVPGAYSSAGGSDFKEVLSEILKVKDKTLSVPMPEDRRWLPVGEILGEGVSIAWRTFDAQFWGVPQRRRRCYLVADFAGECAGQILFESEGVSGYSSQGSSSWEGTSRSVENCFRTTSSFEPGAASRIGGHCWEGFVGTLCVQAGDNQVALVIENHPADSRLKLGDSETIQTLTQRMGTGGGNVPLIMDGLQTPQTLKIRSGCEGGGKGALIQDNKSATLSCNNDQTVFVPSYALQGSMLGRKNENGPKGNGVNNEVCFTLNTVDNHAVVYGLDRASFNQGQNAQYNISMQEEQAQTLVAKGPHAVAHQVQLNGCTLGGESFRNQPQYVVRRLTPQECAMLQGFPANWCAGLETPNPSEEEISWWAGVFETYRGITATANKPKSEKQIIKWLNNPHSDSAEYRMWGNGVALPCVRFVLEGIVWVAFPR